MYQTSTTRFRQSFKNLCSLIKSQERQLISIAKNNLKDQAYVCADSTSVTFKEFVDYTADKIGAKHAGGVPMFLAKGVLGGDLVKLLTTPMKISNKKISEVYNFVYPSYEEGINSILDS